MTCDIGWLWITKQPEWTAVKAGRKEDDNRIDYQMVLDLHKKGMTTAEISVELKVNHTYIYKIFELHAINISTTSRIRPKETYKSQFTKEQVAYCLDNNIGMKQACDMYKVSYNIIASKLSKERKRRRMALNV